MKRSSFSLNVIMLCLVISIPALFSPMLYCNIIPHWPQKRLAVLFHFFQHSWFAALFSHHLFPVWKEALHVCFGPGGVLAQNSVSCYGWERARLSSWVHPNCPSPALATIFPFYTFLRTTFHPFTLIFSPPPCPFLAPDRQQTYCCSCTAKPIGITTIFMTYYTTPIHVLMSFIFRVRFGTSRPHVKLSSPTLVYVVKDVATTFLWMFALQDRARGIRQLQSGNPHESQARAANWLRKPGDWLLSNPRRPLCDYISPHDAHSVGFFIGDCGLLGTCPGTAVNTSQCLRARYLTGTSFDCPTTCLHSKLLLLLVWVNLWTCWC